MARLQLWPRSTLRRSSFRGGPAGAGEGALVEGSDLKRAYRRLGELQAVARRYPDLESAEIKVKFFSEDNDEDDEDAWRQSLQRSEWSIDVSDKATG